MAAVFQIWSKVSSVFQRNNIRWGSLLPGVILAASSAATAAVLFATDHDEEKCPKTYWAYLFLIGTVYTTIGYGSVVPCTAAGRAVVVIYAIFSIPVFVLLLNNLGKIFATTFGVAWEHLMKDMKSVKRLLATGLAKLFAKLRWDIRKIFPKEVQSVNQAAVTELTPDQQMAEYNRLPVAASASITAAWLVLSACVFCAIEDNWYFGDGMYFIMISILTIGFGDIAPVKYDYTLFYVFLLVIGMALFSMTLNVIQMSLDAFGDNIAKSIARQYKQALLSQSVDDQQAQVTDQDSFSGKMEEMFDRQAGGKFRGKIINFLLPHRVKKHLIELLESSNRRRNQYTQTTRDVADASTMAIVGDNLTSSETQTFVTVQKYAWLRKQTYQEGARRH